MTLGENITKIMKEKGITGKVLADKLHTSASYISEIKNDKQDPSLKKLKDIAEVLGVPAHELLKNYRIEMDKRNNISESYYNGMTGREEKLIEKYRQLSSEQKIKLEGIIEGMLMSADSKTDKKGA